ncbi:hypothetical protein [Saccharibacillus endophyticus]|uniref:Uncharacterized protein n=1 Tax=Saccharibacillus endophyticus TaxID=2060666 RepID=A0ABQ1ZZZ2_9BACL|nr:hypothetical protein [Saccharibacillus endophyticus]GGH81892.1 hypothetical protein GCM10007362_32380 [Saccharibacillus endophyticus]
MTYSQRDGAQAGASSDIAHLEYRIGELNDRAGRLLAEIEASQNVPEERLPELRAQFEQAKTELAALQNELSAYED